VTTAAVDRARADLVEDPPEAAARAAEAAVARAVPAASAARVVPADRRRAARAPARAASFASVPVAAARLPSASRFPTAASVRTDGLIVLYATGYRRPGPAARRHRARLPVPIAWRDRRRAAPRRPAPAFQRTSVRPAAGAAW